MSRADDIRYDVLIDRLIGDFQPVRRLWPVGGRLCAWVLLELVILVTVLGFQGLSDFIIGDFRYAVELAIFFVAGVGAAGLALTSAIPGREISRRQLVTISLLTLAGVGLALTGPAHASVASDQFVSAGSSCLLCVLSLVGIPWATLFWAVRRGVPLRPILTGTLTGAAAFCCAFAGSRLFCGIDDLPFLVTWQLLPAVIGTALSAIAGNIWLNPITVWGLDSYGRVGDRGPESLRTDQPALSPRKNEIKIGFQRPLFALALATSVVPFAIFLHAYSGSTGQIPEFDRAIAGYERSLTNFSPNVPSDSVETLLTAYIDDGMPAYMWDFGPSGYKLVGGRLERMPDGALITYTLFQGQRRGIMCIFRETDVFIAPPNAYKELRHLLFYRYKGYSICLINVGGYGMFTGVIISPLSIEKFIHVVLAASL
jgi:hypothetical protein